MLPMSYTRADAVFNVQRSALADCGADQRIQMRFPKRWRTDLHQPYRFALVPGLEETTLLREPGLLGCALSGAGPSILVFL